MTDRYQAIALAEAVAGFVAALHPVALASATAADVMESVEAGIAATSDGVDRVAVLVAGIRALGAAGAGSFADWLAAASRIGALPRPTLSPALTRAQDLAKAASQIVSAACWQEAAVSVISAPPPTRAEVEAARARLVVGVEPVLDAIARIGDGALHAAVRNTIDLAVAGLDEIALTIAPLALIRTPRSLPSTVLAWHLYADPERCTEIVAQSGTTTPLFLPRELTLPAPTAI